MTIEKQNPISGNAPVKNAGLSRPSRSNVESSMSAALSAKRESSDPDSFGDVMISAGKALKENSRWSERPL
jgi:hypothetical protein